MFAIYMFTVSSCVWVRNGVETLKGPCCCFVLVLVLVVVILVLIIIIIIIS